MATLLPMLLLLAKADLTGSVRTEVQAGEAPTISDPNPSFYGAALLRPDVTLKLLSPTTETLVSEAPRLMMQKPNSSNLDRPLFLNAFQVEHKGHRGVRLNWDLHLTSTAGEMDYAALSQALGQQAALPYTLKLFTADGNALVGWRLSRRWRLTTLVEVLRRQPLGTPPSGGLTLPTETDETLEPQLEHTLSTRQSVQLQTKLTHYNLTGDIRLEAIETELQLGWRYQLSRHHELQLAAGAAVATAQQRSDPSLRWTSLSPLAEAVLVSSIPLTRTTSLRSRVGGKVVWYLDPILGVSLPQGQFDANMGIAIAPAWLVELDVRATTNISRDPLPNSPIETMLSAGVPLRYIVQQNLFIEWGGRFSERGPHLTTPGFSLRQREILGYLAVTATTQ